MSNFTDKKVICDPTDSVVLSNDFAKRHYVTPKLAFHGQLQKVTLQSGGFGADGTCAAGGQGNQALPNYDPDCT